MNSSPEFDDAYDARLVLRLKLGEEEAMIEIMDRHRPHVHAFALSILNDAGEAEDITNSTFAYAYRRLEEFRGASLARWLRRIAARLACKRYWFFFLESKMDGAAVERLLASDSATVNALKEAGDDSSEFTGIVERCIAKLDPQHREILHLRNALNRSYSEIADTLGINVATVKSRLQRAREALRQSIVDRSLEMDESDEDPEESTEPDQSN